MQLDLLRKNLVWCMRDGETLIINVERLAPNFKEEYAGTEDTWPADLIFNREVWSEEENYMKVVREHENVSLGGLNKG